jgi:hypothetical protein
MKQKKYDRAHQYLKEATISLKDNDSEICVMLGKLLLIHDDPK